MKVKLLSCVRLLSTPWTTAHQALRPWDFPGKSTGVKKNRYMCIYYWITLLWTWANTTGLITYAAAAAKSLQPCPTLWDPIDSSPPGPSVPGILQARILEWVAISFSNAWKRKVKVNSLSCVWILATPWTAAYQAPPSMEFSRQEYWSGVPLPSLIDVYYILIFHFLKFFLIEA